MYSRIATLWLFSSLALLGGCGTSPAPTSVTATGTYPSLNGNWEFISSSLPTFNAAILDFTGALQSNGSGVTGTLHSFDLKNLQSPCVTLAQDLPTTGTVDTSGHLTLNIAIGGGTAVIKASLTSNLQFPAVGSYVINGGTCTQPSSTAFAQQFLPLSGTFTGMFTSLGTTSTTAVTAALVQTATPDADGLFPLAGTITLAGTCNITFSFTGGAVSGNEVNLFHQATYQSPNGEFTGASLPDGSGLVRANIAAYNASGCTDLSGSLKKQ